MNKVKLQLALDRLSYDECLKILEETSESIDWIEIGTGVIKEYGMSIVREIRENFPETTIVADMKTCDAGKYEAAQAYEAGADITTVMAFASDQTISDMLHVALAYEGRIMVDLLGVSNKNRIRQIQELGVDLVSLHFGIDMQKNGSITGDIFELVNEIQGLQVAVAGGINLESLPAILPYQPTTLIVGGGITKQSNRKQAAVQIKEAIQEYERSHSNCR